MKSKLFVQIAAPPYFFCAILTTAQIFNIVVGFLIHQLTVNSNMYALLSVAFNILSRSEPLGARTYIKHTSSTEKEKSEAKRRRRELAAQRGLF